MFEREEEKTANIITVHLGNHCNTTVNDSERSGKMELVATIQKSSEYAKMHSSSKPLNLPPSSTREGALSKPSLTGRESRGAT